MYKVIHPFNFYKQGDLVDDATAMKSGLQYFEKVNDINPENKMITTSDVMIKTPAAENSVNTAAGDIVKPEEEVTAPKGKKKK